MEERYCSNCRAELPRRADECPECGVYAGDVFDGRMPRRGSPVRWGWIATLVIVAAITVAASWLLLVRDGALPWRDAETPRADPPPVRVVGDRPGGARRAPGAAISEAEAIRILRRELVVRSNVESNCLVIMSNSFDARAYTLTAYDRCSRVRMGRWRVDAKTGAVSR